ncbi:MAG: hypothetical protein HBSAPP02_17900 [Phycisphaerae bacterium]|nr:MAG: hypothetical protein HBSAPP02_17900 [Phycisphaerae bacterium]
MPRSQLHNSLGPALMLENHRRTRKMQPDLIEIRRDGIRPINSRGNQIAPNETSQLRHMWPRSGDDTPRASNETDGQDRRARAGGVRRQTRQPSANGSGGDGLPPSKFVVCVEMRHDAYRSAS